MSIEAMKQALEALESFAPHNGVFWRNLHKEDAEIANVIASLRQAIEQYEKQKPVAWQGCDLDGIVEAFERVIEAHFFRKNPFHNPIDADAQMALRILRGFIPYMKQYTTPQPQQAEKQEIDWKDQYEKQKRRSDMWQRKYEKDIGPIEKAGPVTAQREWVGLTDEDRLHLVDTHVGFVSPSHPLSNDDWINYASAIEAKLKEKNA